MGAEVGLEIRVAVSSVRKELVFVAVEQIDLSIAVDCGDVFEKGARLQQVIVIEEGDVITPCSSDALG